MRQSLREKIYNTIRNQITYGQLHPGERLVESKLVENFKSSRSPIREALRQLESEGLVTVEKNKGITVCKLSIDEIKEIYDIRWLLESHASGLTANKATKEFVATLGNLHEKLKKAASKYDLEVWLQNNALFHDLLHDNCGNTNLVSVIRLFKRRTYRYQYLIVRNAAHFDNAIEHHDKILQACQQNDGKMAEKYSKYHLRMTKKVLLDYLGKLPDF